MAGGRKKPGCVAAVVAVVELVVGKVDDDGEVCGVDQAEDDSRSTRRHD